MADAANKPGKTTIAPEVLLTIARLTTLGVPGVSRLSDVPGGVNRMFHRRPKQEGVEIEVVDDCVNANIYVILEAGVNIREVSRNIQREVARAISTMVGMEAGQINVHIEDIDYPSDIKT